MEQKEIKCPKCGSETNQHKKGYTAAGSQSMYCNQCGCKYTPEPKSRAYSEEVRKQALKLLALGNTGRGIGKALNMSKANAYRWAREEVKKRKGVWISPATDLEANELDEIFWFTKSRKGSRDGVNTYIMTMVSRAPRQILAYAVDYRVKAKRIQEMVDRTAYAQTTIQTAGQHILM